MCHFPKIKFTKEQDEKYRNIVNNQSKTAKQQEDDEFDELLPIFDDDENISDFLYSNNKS